MSMTTLIQVTERQVKKCDRCGTLIAFHKNRHGKSYPVEVYDHPKFGMVYHANYGAYGNMTGWHSCQAVLERQARYEADRKKEQENAKREEIAGRFLPRMLEIVKNFTEERRAEAEAVSREYAEALKAAGVE